MCMYYPEGGTLAPPSKTCCHPQASPRNVMVAVVPTSLTHLCMRRVHLSGRPKMGQHVLQRQYTLITPSCFQLLKSTAMISSPLVGVAPTERTLTPPSRTEVDDPVGGVA